MKNTTKFISYDKENDIFFIHKGFSSDEKFKGNIDAGQLILDISTKGRVRGIEIMKATNFLKLFDITENMLENLSGAEFSAHIEPNCAVISLILKSKNSNKEMPAKIAVPLNIN